jgi:hypothetical protein
MACAEGRNVTGTDKTDKVIIVRIENEELLETAFSRVLEAPDVSSCIIEPDHLQLRFVSEEDVAERLLHRIYLSGGLVWSSRHDLSSDLPSHA